MAAMFAHEQKLDESIVLNAKGFIADGSKTNLFLIKDNKIYTPALIEGPVNGVMRRHLVNELKKENYSIIEKEIKIEDLLDADEVFFTNALRGIQWAEKFRDKTYKNTITKKIFENALPKI
jgi:branched-chain amino acid aminotransferase